MPQISEWNMPAMQKTILGYHVPEAVPQFVSVCIAKSVLLYGMRNEALFELVPNPEWFANARETYLVLLSGLS